MSVVMDVGVRNLKIKGVCYPNIFCMKDEAEIVVDGIDFVFNTSYEIDSEYEGFFEEYLTVYLDGGEYKNIDEVRASELKCCLVNIEGVPYEINELSINKKQAVLSDIKDYIKSKDFKVNLREAICSEGRYEMVNNPS